MADTDQTRAPADTRPLPCGTYHVHIDTTQNPPVTIDAMPGGARRDYADLTDDEALDVLTYAYELMRAYRHPQRPQMGGEVNYGTDPTP